MDKKYSKNLVLFFSRSISLQDWDNAGILSREIMLYLELIKNGWKISFITYGDKSDLSYKKLLDGIDIYCNQFGLPQRWYEAFIFIIHRKILKRCHLIKTNQMSGADIALKVAKFFNKPVINRNGYLPSTGILKKNGADSKIYMDTVLNENLIFRSSNAVTVSTEKLSNIVIESGIPKHKVSVIPNFIDVDKFYPIVNPKKFFDCIFVGRISEEKNIENLIEAISKTDYSLLIVGQGPLKNNYMKKYQNANVKIFWENSIQNDRLPTFYNKCKIFILPSFYEGHPKALLEAMSCGMLVIASNVVGNKEIIQDGKNGFLCKTTVDSIQSTIHKVMKSDQKEISKIKKNARDYILHNFTLDKIVKLENKLYKHVLNNLEPN